MIGYITGHVLERTATVATVLARGGIGYDITVGDTPGIVADHPTTLWCWQTGGDDPKLLGFTSQTAKQLAQLIANKVQGIGPSGAHQLVATNSVDTLARLIAAGDSKELSKSCKGIGPKKAEAIIHDLKGLVTPIGDQDRNRQFARQALAQLGLEVTPAIEAALSGAPNDTSVSGLVGLALAVVQR